MARVKIGEGEEASVCTSIRLSNDCTFSSYYVAIVISRHDGFGFVRKECRVGWSKRKLVLLGFLKERSYYLFHLNLIVPDRVHCR